MALTQIRQAVETQQVMAEKLPAAARAMLRRAGLLCGLRFVGVGQLPPPLGCLLESDSSFVELHQTPEGFPQTDGSEFRGNFVSALFHAFIAGHQ
jgi:hypothetical protein